LPMLVHATMKTTTRRRMIKRRRLMSTWVLVATLALSAVPAEAATATVFDPVVDVKGIQLQLNGAGTRSKAIFKLYDMALYTARKVDSADELLALQGPKRLSFVARRELPGTELGRLFAKGLSENSPEDLVRRHTLSTARLIEIFSGRPKLPAGESFAMEFVPGKGTQFYIAGKTQGEPVGDDEFFQMVLRIWVGRTPADPALRDALLGKGD
jgi:hypothetical protein